MIRAVHTATLAASLVVFTAGSASAQRGARGTMGVPHVTTAPPPARPAPPPSTGRGWMMVPGYQPAGTPRRGDLPRIVTHQGSGYIRGTRLGSGYAGGSTVNNGPTYNSGASFGNGSSFGGNGFGRRFESGTSHRWRPGYTRLGVGFSTCSGCFSASFGGRKGRFFNSFVGYPFAVPIFVPYFYESTYEPYVQPAVVESYEPVAEPARAASKLIVVGAGAGAGGDALTIETIGDSVRLSWLAAGRAAREVKLFVADSAQRQLATRSASPSSPTATFEVSTLSAPVAYAGVTVTFADGVMSTTLVPYRRLR